MPKIYLVWMQRSGALVVLLALIPAQPARADLWQNLVYLWNYGDLPPQNQPQQFQPQYQGQQPVPVWRLSGQRQARRSRELVGIPINPITKPGYAYLIELGNSIDEDGWFQTSFPSITAFGVDMAPGRYQMQADWDPELTILLDVNDSAQIVWLGFYFYPYFAY